MQSWQAYYEATKDLPHSPLLEMAVTCCLRGKQRALDLGAGAMRDSIYLMRQGFHVSAVDKNPPPIRLQELAQTERLVHVQSAFEGFDFPQGRFDLVNAQYALPFVPRRSFDRVWQKLVASLAPGGVFVGQMFGDRDEWSATESSMTFHSADAARADLKSLDLLSWREQEGKGHLASGKPKYWHAFHIIARKP